MDEDNNFAGMEGWQDEVRRNQFLRSGMPVPDVYKRPDIQERKAVLANVISAEILPRLRQHHHGIRELAINIEPPSAEEIEAFGDLVIGPSIEAATAYFRKMQAKGHSLDTLFLHLLEPAARYLGDLWTQDRCDFIDVTIGVARLQELLTLFSATIQVEFRDMHHHALLISMTGEKHVFGVDMVAKFMRGAGWTVATGEQIGIDACARMVTIEKFGVVGVTISSTAALEAGARTIAAIRRASVNPSIGIMVGGPVFRENATLAVQIGADAAAPDAPSAVILAKKLLVSAAIRA